MVVKCSGGGFGMKHSDYEDWAWLGFCGREVMMNWLGFGDGYEARVVDSVVVMMLRPWAVLVVNGGLR